MAKMFLVSHSTGGSTAVALLAGIPQILCPFLFDQFYWAKRMFWLGVSPEPLKRCDMVLVDGNYTSIKEAAEKLARSISYALSPEVRACALEVAEKLSLENFWQLLAWLANTPTDIESNTRLGCNITALAFVVLVPVNWTNGTLVKLKDVTFSDIYKLSISNVPPQIVEEVPDIESAGLNCYSATWIHKVFYYRVRRSNTPNNV
ncbi:uncharacterized protein LOC141685725 [Apium graveolens]|uniref:uncharacterized protein LOC141685725 n=1 Tax=Apium graveolens TaxID=4045 RepID=UPI003D79BB13